jgi:PAS domain S-box-containing protein
MESNVAVRTPLAGLAGEEGDLPAGRRSESDLEERNRLLTFCADVGAALARGETLKAALAECCGAMVRHLGGDFASVWTLRPWGDLLDLEADAGPHASQLARQVTVPVGRFRIGRVALEKQPLLVDLRVASIHEDDKNWAGRAGMVAFAGYPLVVGDRLVGVMAMYAARPLTEAALHAMGAVADQIALGIDRDRAAEAVRTNEERVRSLLDNMLDGVITIDGRGTIESVNPAAEAMFGYDRDELVGRHFKVLVPEGASADKEQLLRRVYEKVGRATEWEGRRKSGDTFPLEVTIFEFLTPSGRRLAGCLRDLSERRALERMKADFTATVSHELRTPLTCVLGYLDLLGSGQLGELPEMARDAVERAQAAALRLQALTTDILDLARMDAGRLELDRRPMEIDDAIRASLHSVAALAEREEISLEVASSSGVVVGDRDRLAQVLVNLLSNAIKFSPRGSRVTVSTRPGPGHVELRIEDQGRGIPASHLPSLFERFRQVEASDARRKGGAGLGLAISRAIVQAHDGTIGVESEEGKGSRFWFRIPCPSGARRSDTATGS